jgi:hypothetical protein
MPREEEHSDEEGDLVEVRSLPGHPRWPQPSQSREARLFSPPLFHATSTVEPGLCRAAAAADRPTASPLPKQSRGPTGAQRAWDARYGAPGASKGQKSAPTSFRLRCSVGGPLAVATRQAPATVAWPSMPRCGARRPTPRLLSCTPAGLARPRQPASAGTADVCRDGRAAALPAAGVQPPRGRAPRLPPQHLCFHIPPRRQAHGARRGARAAMPAGAGQPVVQL